MESSHHHHLHHQDHHHLLVGSSTNLLLSSNNIQHTSNTDEELDCHSYHPHYLDAYTKEETKLLFGSSTKFTDLLTNDNFSRTQQKEDDLSEKLMLKTLLLQSPNDNYHVGNPFESMSTQIHPSLVGFHGISSMEDVNLQPLNLFSMDRSCPQTYARLQHSIEHQNLPSLNNNGPKRSSSKLVEPKATQSISKRQRAESRSSCPPFKVRKEKLGDRIAALQQMVAPFGKTDTASVLMEAIGYIKFLQSQVETLSVPYMKLSSRNKSNNNNMQEGLCGKEEEADLRSVGLCLVPLSCMNYIANDGGCDGTWPSNPHNYNPGF